MYNIGTMIGEGFLMRKIMNKIMNKKSPEYYSRAITRFSGINELILISFYGIFYYLKEN